jgi:hypothetical protein
MDRGMPRIPLASITTTGAMTHVFFKRVLLVVRQDILFMLSMRPLQTMSRLELILLGITASGWL